MGASGNTGWAAIQGQGALIFLTVGTHEPFDRLVRCVDEWCETRAIGASVFGQITDRAEYRPKHFETVPSLTPTEYGERFAAADYIISHAGMGSIITALSKQKPIVILPRRGHLRETRNDHQFATIQRFRSWPGIYAATDETELFQVLNRVTDDGAAASQRISAFAEEPLIKAVREFIFTKY